jgi:ribonuclease-3
MSNDLTPLLKQFNIVPKDMRLFEMAFTHSSVNGLTNSPSETFDYERLEFLGDSVVGMVVSELVYIEHPEMDQGGLSQLKSQFIRTEGESSYALRFHFDEYIRVGKSFQGDVKSNLSILEDVFESFIGATYLDQGLDFTYKLVKSFFENDVKRALVNPDENPKSELQEAMQADHKESVTYAILDETGPAHDKTFYAAVYFETDELGRGEGRSKKEAETNAARNALSKLAKARK